MLTGSFWVMVADLILGLLLRFLFYSFFYINFPQRTASLANQFDVVEFEIDVPVYFTTLLIFHSWNAGNIYKVMVQNYQTGKWTAVFEGSEPSSRI